MSNVSKIAGKQKGKEKGKEKVKKAAPDPNKQWQEFQKKTAKNSKVVSQEDSPSKNSNSKNAHAPPPLEEFSMVGTVTDPSHPSFERQDNTVYKAGGSLMYPNPEQFPEVKEYMGWRLKRNKKRLVRLEHAARIIQGSFRAHLAWIIVRRLREGSAAGTVQRTYRGWIGRLEFLQKMKELWAAQVIQRTIRGYLGRTKFKKQRAGLGSQVAVAKVWRGALCRMEVTKMKYNRSRAATLLQGLWRKRKARR